MNHKIPCHVIQDLLPLYVEKITGELTGKDIEEHLNSCDDCKAIYDRMKKELDTSFDEYRQETKREINYLKTLKMKNIRNIICGAGAAVALVLAGIGGKLFIIGSPTESYMTTYIDVDDAQIHVGGMFWDSASVYSRYKLKEQEDGTKKLVIYACLTSGWNRKGVFNITIEREDVDVQVDIGGAVVKSDGTLISKMANDLYRAKNPYIGDVSANGRLADILKLWENMGGFKNELQTSEKPYGWILRREESVLNSAAFESQMKDYGCVFLALIDNLGEITWIYTVETQEGAVERQTTLTMEEASEYLGAPVKSFGDSPEKVQDLLDRLVLS